MICHTTATVLPVKRKLTNYPAVARSPPDFKLADVPGPSDYRAPPELDADRAAILEWLRGRSGDGRSR